MRVSAFSYVSEVFCFYEEVEGRIVLRLDAHPVIASWMGRIATLGAKAVIYISKDWNPCYDGLGKSGFAENKYIRLL